MPESSLCWSKDGNVNGGRPKFETALEKSRAVARGMGLAEDAVTTFRWSPQRSRLTLTTTQLDWLGSHDGKLVFAGLPTKAHLMTPDTRRMRKLAPDDIANAMQAAGI